MELLVLENSQDVNIYDREETTWKLMYGAEVYVSYLLSEFMCNTNYARCIFSLLIWYVMVLVAIL